LPVFQVAKWHFYEKGKIASRRKILKKSEVLYYVGDNTDLGSVMLILCNCGHRLAVNPEARKVTCLRCGKNLRVKK